MDAAQSLGAGSVLIGRIVGGRSNVRHMAGNAVELVMCIGVRKHIGLNRMAVLAGLISGTRLIVKFVLAKSSHNHYFRLFKQTSLQFLDLL